VGSRVHLINPSNVSFGVAVTLGWTWLTAVALDARRAVA